MGLFSKQALLGVTSLIIAKNLQNIIFLGSNPL